MAGGWSPQPGDILTIIFGDGWRQQFDYAVDQFGLPTISPRSDPYPINIAQGGGGGDPPGVTCDGSYHAVYQYTVTVIGPETHESYVFMGYEWQGNC